MEYEIDNLSGIVDALTERIEWLEQQVTELSYQVKLLQVEHLSFSATSGTLETVP